VTIRGWDPPHLDPMLTTTYRVHVPITFTHSRLVKHKAGPSVAPGSFVIEGDLAESWSQPNDTTWIFKLRRGVRWHPKPPVNGRELTADDVVYSVNRFMTVKGNPSAYMLRAVDRVDAPDKHTVRFVLKEPFAWFLDVVANPMSLPPSGKYDLGWEFPGSIGRTDRVQIKDTLRQRRPNLRTVEYVSNVETHISLRTDAVPAALKDWAADAVPRSRQLPDRHAPARRVEEPEPRERSRARRHARAAAARQTSRSGARSSNLGYDYGGRLVAAWLDR